MFSKLRILITTPPVEDYLKLCTQDIRAVEDFAVRGNLLNQRQCEDLSSKLLKVMSNIRRLVSHCGASPDIFRPALKKLYPHAEKAKALVSNCGEEDWLTAAVFQIQNENAFRQILLDIGLCYNVIYEQAICSSGSSNDFPEDLRLSSLFSPATEDEIQQDRQDLEKRLEDLASEPINTSNVPALRTLKQWLAGYLLLKLKHTSEQSEATALDTCSAILWAKESEPRGTWGKNSSVLGIGSGGSGVCKAEWMGISCAKKLFDATRNPIHEATFMKEAGILAHLNHPCIVKFFCCGNEQLGYRFIAMELMEKSLLRLIEEQKNQFPIAIAVDLMVQMARGMCYLHGQRIAHRDLKPLNVVVKTLTYPDGGDHFCVKLVDFGMSKTKVEASKSKTMSGCGIGTTQYKAPEVYRKGRISWFKADVFSFAMTCAHVLSLEKPFGDMKPLPLYQELLNGTRPKLPAHCPQELVGLLQDCWNKDSASRPSFFEICTRLETLQHKLLRGFSSPCQVSQTMDSDVGVCFTEQMVIDAMFKEESSIRNLHGDGTSDEVDDIELTTVDEVEDELVDVNELEKRNVVSCPCGGSLEFLPRSTYPNNMFRCNLCAAVDDKEVYHCATCNFDAHEDCAEIKDEVKVFFHDHSLHLLVEYYYDSNPQIACDFCGELLQGSKWVYNCKDCNFNVHALCTKHDRQVELPQHLHPLTLVQSTPRKQASCDSCSGDFKRYRYTCTRKGCSIDLHPSCYFLPRGPLCIFDFSHRLELVQFRVLYLCGKCGGVGSSWCYKCRYCRVDVHVDCVMEVEEAYDWNETYERLMLNFENKADHAKMASAIAYLLYMLLISTGLETSSLVASRPRPVATSSQPILSLVSLVSSETPSNALELPVDLQRCCPAAIDDVELRRKILALFSSDVDFQRKLLADGDYQTKLSAAFDNVDLNLQSKSITEREERKAKRMAVAQAELKARVELVSGQGRKLENLERLLQEHNPISELDARVIIGAQKKLRKLQDFVHKVISSKVRMVPRIALRSSSIGNYRKLRSPRDGYPYDSLYLLCEEPGHEHIVATPENHTCGIRHCILPVEEAKAFLVAGLHVVQEALNKATDVTDYSFVTLPILGKEPWDLCACKLEKPDVQTDLANANVEDMESQQGTDDTAVQRLRNYLEDENISIFETFGLLRVVYTTTEQGECPRYKQGSVAWLCAEHRNEGVEAGVLESYPLRMYHNYEYDQQRGFL